MTEGNTNTQGGWTERDLDGAEFQSTQGELTFYGARDLEESGGVEGVYEEAKILPNSKFAKPSYFFKTLNGSKFAVGSSKLIEDQMKTVPLGSYVRLRSGGKKRAAKSGTEFYDIKVEFLPPKR